MFMHFNVMFHGYLHFMLHAKNNTVVLNDILLASETCHSPNMRNFTFTEVQLFSLFNYFLTFSINPTLFLDYFVRNCFSN